MVLDLEEAQLVADYILGKGDSASFMKRFANACSQVGLTLIEISNVWASPIETTMLKVLETEIEAL